MGEATYLEKSAVLFYSYEKSVLYPYEKGELQVWLVNEYGIEAYYKQSTSEKQINKAISKLRDSLGVDSLQRSRVPHEKGSIEVVANLTNLGVLLNSSIDDLTRILLPTAIVDKLITVKHLIVVPALGIGTVPYAILKLFKDDSFLIDRMLISIAPSLFDLGTTLYKWSSEFPFRLL